MTFPTQWLQVWANPLNCGERDTLGSLYWFSLDAPFIPIIVNLLFLESQIQNWIVPSIGQCNLNQHGATFVWRAWLKIPGNTYFLQNGLTPNPPWLRNATSTQAAVIRRDTGGLGRSQRGRVYLPIVDYSFVDGNFLTTAGQAFYQSIAIEMTQPFSVAGVNFFPSLVSYKNSTLEVINSCDVNPRTGRMMRWNKPNRHAPPLVPKPPPP